MARTGAIFGGEHSAHYYFRDFWNADTGMLAALHVLAALGGQDGPLSGLVAQYDRYAASGEINTTVDDQTGRAAAVRAAYEDRDGVDLDELDGLTVTAADWWFNLRPSNTEPLLRLNVEARDAATMAKVRDEVLAHRSEAERSAVRAGRRAADEAVQPPGAAGGRSPPRAHRPRPSG